METKKRAKLIHLCTEFVVFSVPHVAEPPTNQYGKTYKPGTRVEPYQALVCTLPSSPLAIQQNALGLKEDHFPQTLRTN